MKKEILLKLKSIPYKTWVLLVIFALGIFLRTYHFQAWLDFENDQVAEAQVVQDVLQGHSSWPLLGPDMTGSGSPHGKIFHLGPIFYYFQIISAKIFGLDPAASAYPILFFSILSLPLFYLFIQRYFTQNLSLILTGLYVISFFGIQYSRFAWNPNLIPFFVLLFLLSLHEFMIKKEKASWLWTVSLGVALGVGFQLHAILMAVFPGTLFSIFIFLFFKDKKLWKKMAAVLLIAFLLNVPQVISETRTNFANTKIFLHNFSAHGSAGQAQKNSLPRAVANAVDCHIEANAYMASSAGTVTCPLSYMSLLKNNPPKMSLRTKETANPWNILLFGFLFSLCGYTLLIFRCIQEEDASKKYFLRLIALYLGISFLVMALVVNAGFVDFRYFIHTFFVPLIFLGLLAEYSPKKFTRSYLAAIGLLFFFIAAINMHVILANATVLQNKNRSNEHFVILGEIEPMLQYIIANSAGQREAQLTGDPRYLSNFAHALQYIADEKNFTLIQIPRINKILPQKSLFYIMSNTQKFPLTQEDGYTAISHRDFGQVSIYVLSNHL